MEIQEGGGSLAWINPGGRGGGVTVIQEIRVGGGVKKPCHPSGGGGGGWIFSGITHLSLFLLNVYY